MSGWLMVLSGWFGLILVLIIAIVAYYSPAVIRA